MQAETSANAGSPHKGLVENLMEKAKEILPHQITGADPAPASTTTSAGYRYASGGNANVGYMLESNNPSVLWEQLSVSVRTTPFCHASLVS